MPSSRPETMPLSAAAARITQLTGAMKALVPRTAHTGFADRLGELFGIGNSMDLDLALAAPQWTPSESEPRLASEWQQHLDQLCNECQQQWREAVAEFELPEHPDRGSTPYQQFYVAQQRPLVVGAQQLRHGLRQQLAGQSENLAQLAQLDELFEQTVGHFSGRGFAALGRVLKRRYQQQLERYSEERAEQWHRAWMREVHLLLLAELPLRIKPLEGLLDTLKDEERSNA